MVLANPLQSFSLPLPLPRERETLLEVFPLYLADGRLEARLRKRQLLKGSKNDGVERSPYKRRSRSRLGAKRFLRLRSLAARAGRAAARRGSAAPAQHWLGRLHNRASGVRAAHHRRREPNRIARRRLCFSRIGHSASSRFPCATNFSTANAVRVCRPMMNCARCFDDA